MSTVAVVIIAGGQGQRLGGVRKAHLKIGGKRLIDRVASALGASDRQTLIATGHWPTQAFANDPGIAIADMTTEIGGPLAGLAAAIDHLRSQSHPPDLVLTSAVDIPFLPPDFEQRLVAAIAVTPAAYARVGDTFYPTNALWRFESVATLPDAVRNGTAPKSLKHMLQELGGQPVDWADAPNPFANINTVADLLALSRREGGDIHSRAH